MIHPVNAENCRFSFLLLPSNFFSSKHYVYRGVTLLSEGDNYIDMTSLSKPLRIISVTTTNKATLFKPCLRNPSLDSGQFAVRNSSVY